MLESNIKMFKAESKESCVNILKSFPLNYVIILPQIIFHLEIRKHSDIILKV